MIAPAPRLDRAAALRLVALAGATVVGLVVALLPPPAGLSVVALRAIALLVWAVICWATNALDDYLVAMVMALGWIVLRIVPFEVAFACFATGSWWMMVGALGIGVAVAQSGLLRRIALLALRALPPTFVGQTLGLICAGLAIGPALPTVTGKTTLAAPFVLGIAEAMGLKDRSDHATGLYLAMFTGFGVLGPLFMTGTVTNFVILALLPPAVRAGITWGSWFLTYLPTMAIILVLSWLAVLIVCRPKQVTPLSRAYVSDELAKLGGLTRSERLTLGAIGVTIMLWVFGQQLGISPASVALAALIFLLASGVVSREAFQTRVSWPALIFIGVTLNLAEVLPYLGVDAWLGQRLLPVFAPLAGRPVLFFAALMLVVAVVRQFLISDFAVVTIMMLILAPVATAAGINPWTIGIASHLIVQVIWLLPFQNDAFLISHQAAGNRLADPRKAALVSLLSVGIAMVAVLASLPWWRVLGMV